jgi:hypothetical protein
MIACVIRFGKDYPTDSNIDPYAHLSMKQNVTALTGSGRIVIMGYGANKPIFTAALPDGSSPRVILSMEEKVKPKEFLKTDTIKCRSCTINTRGHPKIHPHH